MTLLSCYITAIQTWQWKQNRPYSWGLRHSAGRKRPAAVELQGKPYETWPPGNLLGIYVDANPYLDYHVHLGVAFK